jgi:PAS domain-containing protein
MQCDPVLSKLLDGLSFQDLDNSDDIVFALNADLEITYVNQGWVRFAERNGGSDVNKKWSVGSRFIDAIPLILRPFYLENFAKVLVENRPWEHQYECSSAALYRRFHMLS